MKQDSGPPKDLQAERDIKELMFLRRLSPGQKIIYRDLEEMLGMSKTPIIHALARLEREGLVASRKNRGFFVRELTAAELQQMYDLREKLEAIAIDYAISNHEAADVAALKRALDAYISYPAEVYDSKRFRLDIEFHAQIARMGRNEFLTAMLIQLYESAWAGLHIVFFTPLIPQFKRDHELLYKAITNRNRAEAKQIMRRHERAALKAAVAAMNR
jgi:DNA-binding GntR family transcriptional regulator